MRDHGDPGDAPGVDVVAGVRINDLKLDLDLASGPRAPQGRSVAKHQSWADGFVDARVQYSIAPQWALVGYLDLGAGGSDFTWQAIAGANYAISPTKTLKFGYRYVKVDYHRDDFLYDVATGGPYLGLASSGITTETHQAWHIERNRTSSTRVAAAR